MSMTYQDVQAYNALTTRANGAAQAEYYKAQAAGQSQQAALTAAQNAWQKEYQSAQLSGYLGGQATLPNTQYTTGEFGQYYPGGYRDVAPGTPTQAALQNMQQYGLNQANVTGIYYDPGNMTYQPGTFIRDPSSGAIGQIQSNGQMRTFGDQGDFLRAGGTLDMLTKPGAIRDVGQQEWGYLQAGPGSNFGGRPVGTASLQTQALYGTYGVPKEGAPTMAMQAMYGSNAAPYAGQETMAQNQQRWTQAETAANQTGVWNAPQQSRAAQEAQGQTLDGKSFGSLPPDQQQAYLSTRPNQQQAAADWARDVNNALLSAGYQAPEQQGTQTLTAQQQYWKQAFDQAQANQSNTQAYLTLLSNLRGPADWAKYQQVLGSTPGGMRDLYAASMGQYIPGGGATTGANPQAANLQTMQQQIGGGYGQSGWGGYAGGYTTQPGQPQTPQTGQLQQMAGYQPWMAGTANQQFAPQGAGGGFGGWAQGEQNLGNQQAASGNEQVWGSGIGVGGRGTTPDQQVQATGNGTNMYGGQQQQYNLPAPNQISAQAWGNFTPSQQQMMLGMYEANGWDKNDVQALYNQSLPKYGSNNATAGTWRMQ